jgi:hypothetical protein
MRPLRDDAEAGLLDDTGDALVRDVWRAFADGLLDEQQAQSGIERIRLRKPDNNPRALGNVLTNWTVPVGRKAVSPQGLGTEHQPFVAAPTHITFSERVEKSEPVGGRAPPHHQKKRPPATRGSASDPAGAEPRHRVDGGKAGARSLGEAQRHGRCSKSLGRDRKVRRPGPRGRAYLTWAEVKETGELAHAARRAGTPFNRMVTIRAPRGASDAEGKRYISRKVAHLGQILHRAGHPHIGRTHLEKGPDLLHAHHLMHVPRALVAVIDRQATPDGELHVRRADAKAVSYICKQRQCLSPDYEANIKIPRCKSARIDVPRVSTTKAALALLRKAPAKPVEVRVEPVVEVEVLNAAPMVEPMQLHLALDAPAAPVEPIADALRRARVALGLSQAAAGALIGIRQPHMSNVEAGRHPIARSRVRALQYLAEKVAA